MLIDWFTVAAQALNFAILVWLLKRLLYKPILAAVDARETRVAADLADAKSRQEEASKARTEFEQKNDALDRQRAALLSQATDEANAERGRLLEAARQAAEDLAARREAALRAEAANLDQAITRRAQDEVFAIARQALTELAAASLEERMAEVFIERLRGLAGDAKGRLARALADLDHPARLRSAFELPVAQREAIATAVREVFPGAAGLRFETAPELIAGIELVANGQKLAWSIADYLAALQHGLDELMPPPADARPALQPQAGPP